MASLPAALGMGSIVGEEVLVPSAEDVDQECDHWPAAAVVPT